jgi:hypothetical protein
VGAARHQQDGSTWIDASTSGASGSEMLIRLLGRSLEADDFVL